MHFVKNINIIETFADSHHPDLDTGPCSWIGNGTMDDMEDKDKLPQSGATNDLPQPALQPTASDRSALGYCCQGLLLRTPAAAQRYIGLASSVCVSPLPVSSLLPQHLRRAALPGYSCSICFA